LGLCSAILAVGLSACGGRRAPPRDALVDDVGHRVTLTQPAQRIVSLSPSTTELLFAIGAGSAVVGRTRWCDYPPEVAAVPSVGDGLDPNLELVLSRRPDLVVFYASPGNQSVIARLDRLGIASASLRLDRLDDLPGATRLLGRLARREPRADSLARAFQARLDSARAASGAPPSSPAPAVARAAPARVAVIVWDNPPIVIGAGSFLTDLLALAGARNVFDDVPQPSAPTGIEAITARDPDVILSLGDSVPALARRPEWRSVRAVRERRIVTVRGSEFERPTFRAFDAIRALRASLRPGARP
jgi:ABC-type Fe3+-hydroxamate transport system substrate-binding protein